MSIFAGKLYQRTGLFALVMMLVAGSFSAALPLLFSNKAAASNMNAESIKVIVESTALVQPNTEVRFTVQAINASGNPIYVSRDAYITAIATGSDSKLSLCDGIWADNTISAPVTFLQQAEVHFCYKYVGTQSADHTIDFAGVFPTWIPYTDWEHLGQFKTEIPTPSSAIVRIDNTIPTADLQFPAIGLLANSFKVQFSEPVDPTQAVNSANYVLNNWSDSPSHNGVEGLGTNVGITYNSSDNTATVTFDNPTWYVAPEQQWGVRNIPDLAGNLIEPTTKYSTANINPTDPVMNNAIYSNSYDINFTWAASVDQGTYQSGMSRYEYVLGDCPLPSGTLEFTTATSVATTATTQGDQLICVIAIDRAGNKSAQVPGKIIVDTISPVAVIDPITNPTGGDVDKVTITGSISDANIMSYQLQISDGTDSGVLLAAVDGPIPPFDWDISGLASGEYEVKLTATDKAGNVTVATQIVVIDNEAPVIQVKGSKKIGNKVTPTIIITDNMTLVGDLDYSWQASVDNPAGAVFDGTLLNPEFTVAADGTYKFTLTVVDEFGNKSSKVFTFDYAASVVVPPVVVPAVIAPLAIGETEVLGDSTDVTASIDGTEGSTDVMSATDKKVTDDSADFAWYWWLLIAALIAAGCWFAIDYRKKHKK